MTLGEKRREEKGEEGEIKKEKREGRIWKDLNAHREGGCGVGGTCRGIEGKKVEEEKEV